jgi:4-amino-4-deoxy-L-arabinose transferase-like glycosyltransferase
MQGGHIPERATNYREPLTALGLGLVALAVYASAIGWGLPHATAPDRVKTFAADEILPLETLAEMHSTFVVSKPDRNYGYPWWHYFVASVFQAPYVGYLSTTGRMGAPAPEYPFGLEDPVDALRWLTLIGRTVSVLMGAGIVLSAYFFSKTLWGPLAGAIAATLTMLNYLMLYYSGTGNLDVPAFFWSALGFVVFARILTDGMSLRRAAWLGIWAALALATKEQTLVFFMPLAVLFLIPGERIIRYRDRRVVAIFAGCAAFLAAYIVATGMIVDPQRHLKHLAQLLFAREQMSDAAFYFPPQPLTWAGIAILAADFVRGLAATMGLPVLVVSVAGWLLALRRSPRDLVLLLPLATLFLLLVPAGHVVLRYLLPLTLIIDAFAARAMVVARHRAPRLAWALLLALLVGWRLLVGVDLAHARLFETRDAASRWLATHARPGDRLEYFGAPEALPHLPAEIQSRRIAGRSDWVGELDHGPAVIRYLQQGGPELVITVPDWTSAPDMEHSGDCPPELFAALLDGSAGYELVAHFPRPALLGTPLARPPLDNPSVSPPVRIFARGDVAARIRAAGESR